MLALNQMRTENKCSNPSRGSFTAVLTGAPAFEGNGHVVHDFITQHCQWCRRTRTLPQSSHVMASLPFRHTFL